MPMSLTKPWFVIYGMTKKGVGGLYVYLTKSKISSDVSRKVLFCCEKVNVNK